MGGIIVKIGIPSIEFLNNVAEHFGFGGNMKTLQEKIEVMQAALDGKKIEFKDAAGVTHWSPNPKWNWEDFDYRIKPEPMEFWVNVYSNDVSAAYRTKEEAVTATNSMGYTKTIKVREVIE